MARRRIAKGDRLVIHGSTSICPVLARPRLLCSLLQVSSQGGAQQRWAGGAGYWPPTLRTHPLLSVARLFRAVQDELICRHVVVLSHKGLCPPRAGHAPCAATAPRRRATRAHVQAVHAALGL